MFYYRCNNPKCAKGKSEEPVIPTEGYFDHPHEGKQWGKLCPVCQLPVYVSQELREPA